jgi:geranylgeranyl pyrophosphate synthase
MAFQIVDDIIDFEGDSQEVGKPVGGDLMKGTLTLPAMLALERSSNDSILRQLLVKKDDPECLQKALDYIRASGAIPASYQVARDFQQKAIESLKLLPDGAAKRSLQGVAEYVLERRK